MAPNCTKYIRKSLFFTPLNLDYKWRLKPRISKMWYC